MLLTWSGSVDHAFKLWDIESMRIKYHVAIHKGPILAACEVNCATDMHFIVSSSADR
jgi:hypothetical protein